VGTQGSGHRLASAVRCLVLGAAGVILLSLAGARWGNTPAAAPVTAGTSWVLVAARSLPAGSVLVGGDAEAQRVGADAALPGSLRSPAQVAGRRLLVSVPAGAALLASMLGPLGPAPGRRTVVIVVDADHVDPRLAAGSDADVIAAVDGDGHSGSVSAVATARVVSLTAAGDAATRSTSEHTTPSTAIALDCDSESALRIIWAESYARSVRVLVRDGDDGPPPSPVAGMPR